MTESEHESLVYAVLGWRPGFIARTAARCSVRKAWLLGTITCAAQVLAPAAGVAGWLTEPFPSLTVYVWEAMTAAPVVLAWLMLASGSVLGMLAFCGFGRRGTDGRWQLIVRVGCLSPVATLVPGLIWSVFAAMNELADPKNNLSMGGTKPAWLTSAFVQIIGSCFWMPAGLGLMIANGMSAYRKAVLLMSATDHPQCTCCGYNLTGNVSGICPECGLRIE